MAGAGPGDVPVAGVASGEATGQVRPDDEAERALATPANPRPLPGGPPPQRTGRLGIPGPRHANTRRNPAFATKTPAGHPGRVSHRRIKSATSKRASEGAAISTGPTISRRAMTVLCGVAGEGQGGAGGVLLRFISGSHSCRSDVIPHHQVAATAGRRRRSAGEGPRPASRLPLP